MALGIRRRWIVLAGLALAPTALSGGCSGPEDPEARRFRAYREDSRFCSTWASKREDARKLLAQTWPEGTFEERLKQQLTQPIEDSKKALKELQDLPQMLERTKADYESCMLGQAWEKEWLVEMAAKDKARREECQQRSPSSWNCY